MSTILTFDQLEKAEGLSRQNVKERVSAGKLYSRKMGSRVFYATTEGTFMGMWEKVLDFANALLEKSFAEPASRFGNFIAYYGKKEMKWHLDTSLAKIVAQSLPLERNAGCFLGLSEKGYGYLCLYAECRKQAFDEMIEFAKVRMEATGRLGLSDFDNIAKRNHIEKAEGLNYLLRHLAYIGWGHFVEDGSLENPLFTSK